MAFLEFVIGLFAFIVLLIFVNFGIFIYKLYMYGKNDPNSLWASRDQNSSTMGEVSIPCTISAHLNVEEGLGFGPNRRLSELVVQDGHLILINYSTPNGQVQMKNIPTNCPVITQAYEDLPPSYDVCVRP